MLYTPGNQPRLVSKVGTFGADAVILDLEDAVPLAEKAATRPAVRSALSNLARDPPRYVRVNAMDTGLTFDDLQVVVCSALDGLKLPKVETPDELLEAEARLAQLEEREGLERGQIDLIPLIETAKGVLNVRAIAEASRRVRRLGFGAGDFCRDVAVRFSGSLWEPDGLELLFARSQIVLSSRAAGLDPPIDTVWLDVRDSHGLEQDARAALRLGFGGKSAIHPGQIEIINRVFSPASEEIDYARRVVEAFDKAEAEGSASIAVDGRLVDYAIVLKARSVLERAAVRP
jgi:citrate lyase subunit beta / citryl-CoA lyase